MKQFFDIPKSIEVIYNLPRSGTNRALAQTLAQAHSVDLVLFHKPRHGLGIRMILRSLSGPGPPYYVVCNQIQTQARPGHCIQKSDEAWPCHGAQ